MVRVLKQIEENVSLSADFPTGNKTLLKGFSKKDKSDFLNCLEDTHCYFRDYVIIRTKTDAHEASNKST